MRLAEIESALPNGLHDAKLVSVNRNLISEDTVLGIEVLVGLPDDGPSERDRLSPAWLRFKACKVVVVEPPDSESSFRFPGPADFVISEDEAGDTLAEIVSMLHGEFHIYNIFVRDWFSNIRIIAADLEFEWAEN